MSEKITVKKIALDSAIRAMLDLKAAYAVARENNKLLKKKDTHYLFNITHGYCNQLEEQAKKCDYFKMYHFWDIVVICTDMSETPYETAYKMLALLDIEVTE